MPRSHAPLFDRDRDERIHGPKREELHAYGIPCLWLLLSPVEAQCLLAGHVPTEVQQQCAVLLAPDPLVLAEET